MTIEALVTRKTQDLVQYAAEDLLRETVPGLARIERGEMWAFAVAAGDPDEDDDLDLMVVGGGTTMAVLLNDGAGSFANQLTFPAGAGLTELVAEDADGDGDVDVVACGSDTLAVLLNAGDAPEGGWLGFDDPLLFEAGGSTYDLTIEDLDASGGGIEVAVANFSEDTLTVLRPAPFFPLPG